MRAAGADSTLCPGLSCLLWSRAIEIRNASASPGSVGRRVDWIWLPFATTCTARDRSWVSSASMSRVVWFCWCWPSNYCTSVVVVASGRCCAFSPSRLSPRALSSAPTPLFSLWPCLSKHSPPGPTGAGSPSGSLLLVPESTCIWSSPAAWAPPHGSSFVRAVRGQACVPCLPRIAIHIRLSLVSHLRTRCTTAVVSLSHPRHRLPAHLHRRR